jgi:hypothetical protein
VTRILIGAALLMAMVLASPARAQEISPRMAVSFAAGAGSATSTTGVAIGGSVLFDANDRLALEAQGLYLDRGAGADAFNVTASVLVNVLPASRRLVPYLAAGGGLYRASFELANPRFLGPIGNQYSAGTVVCPATGMGGGPGPGAGFGPGDATCPGAQNYWGVGQMNAFYANRLGAISIPADGVWHTRSFVDPAVSLGGGLRFNVNERVMIRPDVRALLVFADGDTQAVGLYGISVGYRF